MSKKILATEKAPAALGPYSQGVAVNEAYGSYFKKDAPARGCVEVARLPKDMQVEIEAIAVR